MEQQSSPPQNQRQKWFNLKTTGLGYVNDIRNVTGGKGRGRKSNPTLWCRVSALRGAADAPAYTRYDCNVTGAVAQQILRKYQLDEAAGRKVLVSFRMGDSYAEAFIYRDGERKGQPGAIIKARLLALNWVRINNVEVWRAPPSNRSDESSNRSDEGDDESPSAADGESGDESAS